jgi:ATP-dependent Clp protease ATP-binding subunit ClpA
LGKRKKPLATFLFLGPTGVGKTETAKAIADNFFDSENILLRFDMSNYQSKNDIPKLIGSMETQTQGIMTNAIREHPYGVLLLDEIEKADIDLLNIFLTIFDEGYFTDGFGKRVDCKNLVIIATSNAGADYLFKQKDVQVSTNDLITHLIEKKYFTPEFLNRFDGVIAYKPIGDSSMLLIAKKMFSKVQQQIYELHQVQVNVSDQTLQTIISKNFNPAFGARNLDRILRNEIEDKVAKMVLGNEVKAGDVINL